MAASLSKVRVLNCCSNILTAIFECCIVLFLLVMFSIPNFRTPKNKVAKCYLPRVIIIIVVAGLTPSYDIFKVFFRIFSEL